ncbi:MAG: AmmeMemoRadiSam system radical SAM enzyme [Candidatus Hodarchaeales archaeon]
MSELIEEDSEWDIFRPLKSGKLQCLVCPRFCQLSDREVGWCGARGNKEGRIVPRTYGLISSLAIDPIEKKPLYHFLPGTGILSFGSHGCNLGCLHCQNHSISMERDISTLRKKTPKEIVAEARVKALSSIASTYNEPLIAFEFVRDIAQLAHEQNIKMVVVDNGYITEKLAKKIGSYIDAANIDVKGFSSEFYKEVCQASAWKSVLKTCEIFYQMGVHLEITNLIIPTKNDSMEMIKDLCIWIHDNLCAEVPLHFSRFHPDHELRHLPVTPLETLESAYKVAKNVGLKHIYIGNVRSQKGNNTYCHQCGNLLIQRSGFHTTIKTIDNGICSVCQSPLYGIFT